MGGESTKSISGLIWLTLRAVGQVLITPFLAFMVTYFFDFQFDSSGFDLDFRREMLPWIFTASLVYAMLALLLALYFGGGFRPLGVIERGGWLAVLRSPTAKAMQTCGGKRAGNMQLQLMVDFPFWSMNDTWLAIGSHPHTEAW